MVTRRGGATSAPLRLDASPLQNRVVRATMEIGEELLLLFNDYMYMYIKLSSFDKTFMHIEVDGHPMNYEILHYSRDSEEPVGFNINFNLEKLQLELR